MSKILIIFAACVLAVVAQSVLAQTATRIQFAKGTNSAVLKGKTRSHGVAYVLKAKAGQTLILTLTPDSDINIGVQTTLKSEEEGNELPLNKTSDGYELSVPDSCDYKIIIGSDSEQPISFTLTVKIRE